MADNDAEPPEDYPWDGYPSPEDEGLPDYADDDSTAYEDVDRPRFRDSPAILPADEPQAVDEYGITAAEQRAGEPLDMALAREEPDWEPDEEAREEDLAGRLVEPDEGAHTDEEKDVVAAQAGWEGLSAEEAAMHTVPEEEWMRDEVPGDEVLGDEESEERLYEQWPEPEEEYGTESAYVEEEEADFWSAETPAAWEEAGAGEEPGEEPEAGEEP